jgi:hypothetical protein
MRKRHSEWFHNSEAVIMPIDQPTLVEMLRDLSQRFDAMLQTSRQTDAIITAMGCREALWLAYSKQNAKPLPAATNDPPPVETPQPQPVCTQRSCCMDGEAYTISEDGCLTPRSE